MDLTEDGGAPDIVVDPNWLLASLGREDVRVVDTRPPPLFLSGHIPGAVNLPAAFLIGPTGDPVASDVLARLLGRFGLKPTDLIVAVDDGSVQPAAMLVWTLHNYHHAKAVALDGGIPLWVECGGELTREVDSRQPSDYPVNPSAALVAHAQDVSEIVRTGGRVLDVRSDAEFLGTDGHGGEPGRIPGAGHLEWIDNLTEDQGRLAWKHREVLRAMYERSGWDVDAPIVVYCHSGPRATVGYVALKRAGYTDVRLYLRGWREWSTLAGYPRSQGAD